MTRTSKMARMASLVDLTTECSAFDHSGVRDYRINLQQRPTGPSLFRGIVRRGATVVDCALKLGAMWRIFAARTQVKRARAERCAMGWMDLYTTARARSRFTPTRYYSGRVARPCLRYTLVQNLVKSITLNICATFGYRAQTSLSNCRIVSSNRLAVLASIVLSCLRSGIRISRSEIIARRLLQRVGLCLRALRIELFAKLALAAL